MANMQSTFGYGMQPYLAGQLEYSHTNNFTQALKPLTVIPYGRFVSVDATGNELSPVDKLRGTGGAFAGVGIRRAVLASTGFRPVGVSVRINKPIYFSPSSMTTIADPNIYQYEINEPMTVLTSGVIVVETTPGQVFTPATPLFCVVSATPNQGKLTASSSGNVSLGTDVKLLSFDSALNLAMIDIGFLPV